VVAVDTNLEHHGIKGMHWGVRKDISTASIKPNPGVKIKADGSITVEPGASLQRLVRSSGKSMPMKNITYASLNAYDNARYIKVIGGKGFFGGGRDQILQIRATQPIKAPSKKEATKIVSNLILTNPEFRKKNTSIINTPISKGDLDRIRQDPTGKTATAWYEMTNTKLTFDKEFDSDAPYVQSVVKKEMESKGYNALRDENDVITGVAKSPIIIFSPEKSLEVVSVSQITDQVRAANKETLKQYKQQGKDWVDKQVYS
jgi:hypothetical protein